MIDCRSCFHFRAHYVCKATNVDEIVCAALPNEKHLKLRRIIDCPHAQAEAGSQDEDWESEHGE